MAQERVQAYCTNGHPQRIWGSPLMAKPGEKVSFWGGPFVCGRCGASVYGGRRT